MHTLNKTFVMLGLIFGIAMILIIMTDTFKGVNKITKLAKQGNAEAQYNLGVMYAEGRGVKQDYVQAKQWSEQAAKQGYVDAQYNLGVLYIKGLGTK